MNFNWFLFKLSWVLKYLKIKQIFISFSNHFNHLSHLSIHWNRYTIKKLSQMTIGSQIWQWITTIIFGNVFEFQKPSDVPLYPIVINGCNYFIVMTFALFLIGRTQYVQNNCRSIHCYQFVIIGFTGRQKAYLFWFTVNRFVAVEYRGNWIAMDSRIS